MNAFAFDFSLLINYEVIIALIVGTLVGLFIGAIPGIGGTVGIVLLLPFTYNMSPLASIVMLIAVYQSGEYGGSISSIVLGVPGTSAAVVTCLDGAAMAKQGYPGKALGYSLTSSVIGGLIGGLILMFLTIPMAQLTMKFRDPEFFLLGVLGLVCVASLSSKDIYKSAVSVFLGLLVAFIGIDMYSGSKRFTFGSVNLLEGIEMIPLLIGLFAVSEAFVLLEGDLNKRYVTDTKNLKTYVSWKELKAVWKDLMSGSLIGTIIGILPGLGAGPSSWFAYTQAKQSSKNPELFGKGHPSGIVAPEAANNACVAGALIPLLTLGIPGSAAVAVMMGAFLIHGITVGPLLMKSDPNLVYGIFWGFMATVLLMYILGKYTTSLWARLLTLPKYVLSPLVLFLSLMAVYAGRMNMFDVYLAIVVGIIAFFIKKLDYSLPSFVLAYILAPIMEDGLRRALMISRGDYSVFVTRSYSIGIIVVILILIATTVYSKRKMKKKGLDPELGG